MNALSNGVKFTQMGKPSRERPQVLFQILIVMISGMKFRTQEKYLFIYLLNKDQNPTTAGSARINAKEREKERKGRRAKKWKGIETQRVDLLP